MDKFNICGFAGLALEKYGYLTVEKLQKFIKNDPCSGVIISPDAISEVLDQLTLFGFLELIDGGLDRQCIYRRYITPREKEKLFREKM